MFVTASDYDTPPMDLPSLDKANSGFPDFIDEQEDNELQKLFGVTMWDAFKVGLAALPGDWTDTDSYLVDDEVVYGSLIYKALLNSTNVQPDTDPVTWQAQPSNRWLLLKLGADYSYLDKKYKWVGMSTMVKPMIYSLWVRYVVNDSLTGAGNVKSKSENSTPNSPNVRICQSWNRYDAYARGTIMRPNDASIRNCLYGYLYSNASTFDDIGVDSGYSDFINYLGCEFKCPGRQSFFDL